MNRDMLSNIVHTKSYIVDVDPQKNRIYARIHKAIKETLEPSQLLEELHELKHYLSSGFTMLVDARKEDAVVQEDIAFMHDVMDLLIEGGISKIAEIRSTAPMLQIPQKWSSEQSDTGIQQKVFLSCEEAEAWLDT